MSGRTDLAQHFAWVITVAALLAAATDVARGRVYNWLTVPLLAAGLAASAWMGGWRGGADALLGAAAGLLFFGWMFWIGVMGGGDVKLLMALSAWGGFRFSQEVALLSVLLGGAMAVAVLAVKGRLPDFARRMRRFLLSVLVKELEVESPKLDRKSQLPFGVPIAAAAIWVAWGGGVL
jgi:prepilin peptidase CpaA